MKIIAQKVYDFSSIASIGMIAFMFIPLVTSVWFTMDITDAIRYGNNPTLVLQEDGLQWGYSIGAILWTLLAIIGLVRFSSPRPNMFVAEWIRSIL